MNALDAHKQKYRSGFLKAESAVKAYEHSVGDTLFGSINELRYAGEHASIALIAELDEDYEKACDEYSRAIRHTQRAYYDVLEARVLAATKELDEAAALYEGYEDLAASLIPNYLLHKKNIRAIGREMESSAELDKESSDYQEVCNKHIDVIFAFLDDFNSAQGILISAMREREQSQARHDEEISLLQQSLSQTIQEREQNQARHEVEVSMLKESLGRAHKATRDAWIVGAVFCLLGVLLGAFVAWCIS